MYRVRSRLQGSQHSKPRVQPDLVLFWTPEVKLFDRTGKSHECSECVQTSCTVTTLQLAMESTTRSEFSVPSQISLLMTGVNSGMMVGSAVCSVGAYRSQSMQTQDSTELTVGARNFSEESPHPASAHLLQVLHVHAALTGHGHTASTSHLQDACGCTSVFLF